MKHYAAFCSRAFSQSSGACWPLHRRSQSVGMLTPRWTFLNQQWAVLDKCSILLTFWKTIWRTSLCFSEAPTELSPCCRQQQLRMKSYIVFYYFSFLTASFRSVLFTRFTAPSPPSKLHVFKHYLRFFLWETQTKSLLFLSTLVHVIILF